MLIHVGGFFFKSQGAAPATYHGRRSHKFRACGGVKSKKDIATSGKDATSSEEWSAEPSDRSVEGKCNVGSYAHWEIKRSEVKPLGNKAQRRTLNSK